MWNFHGFEFLSKEKRLGHAKLFRLFSFFEWTKLLQNIEKQFARSKIKLSNMFWQIIRSLLINLICFSVLKSPQNILDNYQMKIFTNFILYTRMTLNYLIIVSTLEIFLYPKIMAFIQLRLKHFRNVILIKQINARNY